MEEMKKRTSGKEYEQWTTLCQKPGWLNRMKQRHQNRSIVGKEY